ncbi:MAG TPA: hypothetical protein VJP76_01235 [Candidatus Tumulicola sp.]|nr:hypothetical protein [Candidatus Tumulicola sp.]
MIGLLALSLSFSRAPAQNTPPPSTPETFYSAAVESMRALPQPQYLTYTMEGDGDNLSIGLRVIRHLVWLNMLTGPAGFPSEWSIRHRTDDYASEITDYDGRRLVSTRAFFDPTWYGAFRALRDGMLMYQQTDAPVSAYATPTPGPSPDLRTIAVVTVLGSNVYRVEDRGSATCAGGDPGHALHLVSRQPDPRHQLADVTVDLRNMHFCTMRFDVRESGFSGSVEQHYGSVGGYWLQTDGIIETGVRTLGIMVGHGVWRYRLTQMTFPRSIPAATFVRPWYQ